MYGTWRGRIVAYDRELSVELHVDSDGAAVTLEDQPVDDMEVWVLSPDFLLGMFDSAIPTPDNAKYPCRSRLAVLREEDRLHGAVVSVGSLEDRAGHYELPAWTELQRFPGD